MKKKIFISIIILFILLIIFLLIFHFQNFKTIYTSREDNTTVEEKSIVEKYNDFFKAPNNILYIVNGENITNKDILLTEIFNSENSDNLIEKTINNKIVYQEAIKQNISLKEDEKLYIDNIISTLKDDSTMQEIYKNNPNISKDNINEIIKEKLYQDAIKNEFEHQIRLQIIEGTFIPNDDETKNLYIKYQKTQEKWNNRENIEYSFLLNCRNQVVNSYIANLKKMATIENIQG